MVARDGRVAWAPDGNRQPCVLRQGNHGDHTHYYRLGTDLFRLDPNRALQLGFWLASERGEPFHYHRAAPDRLETPFLPYDIARLFLLHGLERQAGTWVGEPKVLDLAGEVLATALSMTPRRQGN